MWSIKINVGITEEAYFFFQKQAFYKKAFEVKISGKIVFI